MSQWNQEATPRSGDSTVRCPSTAEVPQQWITFLHHFFSKIWSCITILELHLFNFNSQKALRASPHARAQLGSEERTVLPSFRPFKHNPTASTFPRIARTKRKSSQMNSRLKKWWDHVNSEIPKSEKLLKTMSWQGEAVVKWFYFHVENYFHGPPGKPSEVKTSTCLHLCLSAACVTYGKGPDSGPEPKKTKPRQAGFWGNCIVWSSL